MASAGQFVLKDDGTLGLNSSGNGRVFTTGGLCDECCDPAEECTGDGVACAFCATTPSKYYNVTFSGITLCTDCHNIGGTPTRLSWTAGDVINATHEVEQDLISTCQWDRLVLANAVTQTTYTDEACTTADGSSTCDLYVQLWKISATEWSVFAYINATNTTDMFYAIATVAADDCDTSFSVDNEIDGVTFDCFDVSPEPFGSYIAATGGTATVVCQ